jgi:hypothetical protein
MILEEMGIEVGHASFPMTRYSKEERAVIKAELLAAGFSFE